MSTFKTSGIVIKKSQLNEKQEMFVIFSKEFGKITVFSKINKKEKMLDLGSIFNFEAQVKSENSVNDMKNITLIHQFEYTSWSYEMLIEFMELLKILSDFCPKWIPNNEIYEIFLSLRKIKTISREKIIFAKIKLYDILGLLDPNINHLWIKKICTFIAQNSAEDALKLTWLTPELLWEFHKMFAQIKK